MQSGTAVITLNRPVLVEVGGEAPCYLDEATPDALAAALHGLLTDKTQRTQRVAAGLKRAQEFTWVKTARRTLVVLSSVAGVTSAARLGERSEGA
jgi:glycosyltransferase involved in cell wall biosynthesis